jgi:hypothetical protein
METPVKNRLSGSPDQPTSRKSFRIVVAVIAFILLAGAALLAYAALNADDPPRPQPQAGERHPAEGPVM